MSPTTLPSAPLNSQDLHTFGFRGEALSSLCAVSEVAVITRTADQEVWTRVCVCGGGGAGNCAMRRLRRRELTVSVSARGKPNEDVKIGPGKALKPPISIQSLPAPLIRFSLLPPFTAFLVPPVVQVGVRLEYDREGRLSSQTPCPRAVGTTVAVRGLFKTMPVRHKVRPIPR